MIHHSIAHAAAATGHGSFDQPDGRVDCGTNFAFGKRREP
jgi:hypothetical protein